MFFFWNEGLLEFWFVVCLQPSDLFDAILVIIWTSTPVCFRVFRVGGYQFSGVSWPFVTPIWFRPFRVNIRNNLNGQSYNLKLDCLGCSRCHQEITLQSLLSPKYAEDLPPQMDFSGYVRGWIVLKKNCVSEFVHFCFGEFCLCFIFLYAYLPKQPTNIGHIHYCQVHFWWYQQKTLHHNHYRAMYIFTIYTYISSSPL